MPRARSLSASTLVAWSRPGRLELTISAFGADLRLESASRGESPYFPTAIASILTLTFCSRSLDATNGKTSDGDDPKANRLQPFQRYNSAFRLETASQPTWTPTTFQGAHTGN
ncbi:hypothetical protein PG993_011567 [Apiospora rasikravindrae]|uniref:Uncharacterized protein n=1 Tax=Apiospora rasikravindrae TaxID=990691 RepID=A0ABR1RZZ6_9PEZI